MKKYFIMILFVFVVLTTYGQSSKLRVGVLDFTANNISKSEAQTVGEMFTSELVLSGKYDVVDRKNIESLMAEMEFQMSGCTDSSCAVEIGQILALDFMMYGSINKLGESFVINVYMINVETAQIEGTSREKFGTIEESYDIMSVVIRKLIDGSSFDEDTSDLSEQKTQDLTVPESESKSSSNFFEFGVGMVIGTDEVENENGIEINPTYRHMFGPTFGLGGGVLLGYGFGDGSGIHGEPGIRFGLTLFPYFQLSQSLGVTIELKGLPNYINYFGGFAVGLYFDKWYMKFGSGFFGRKSISVDIGYCYKL